MNPSAARALVIALSFVVLGISAVVTTLTWSLLASFDVLPRGMASLLVFVTTYYVGANVVFWKTVVRVSPTSPSRPA